MKESKAEVKNQNKIKLWNLIFTIDNLDNSLLKNVNNTLDRWDTHVVRSIWHRQDESI